MNINDIKPGDVRVLQSTNGVIDDGEVESVDDATDRPGPTEDELAGLRRRRRFDTQSEPISDDGPDSRIAPTVPVTTSWVAPNKRKRDRKPDPFMPKRLREQVQITYPNPPEHVIEAQQKALAAIDDYQAAIDAIRSLGADQEAEKKEHQSLVMEAVRTGSPVDDLRRTDWAMEELNRNARHEVAWSAAEHAVKEFRDLVVASKEEWFEAAIERLDGAHAKARELLAEAIPAVVAWRAKIKAADELARATGRFGNGYHVSAESKLKSRVGMIERDLTRVLDILNSDDPVISGEYLTAEYEMVPPLHTRKSWADAGNGKNWASIVLGQVEAEEGFSKTQFTPESERPFYLQPANRMSDKTRQALAERRFNPFTDL